MNALHCDTLNARFAIPGVATIVPGSGGLAKVEITTPAASAEIYLHGAQVTSWQPVAAREVIFLSALSRFEDGKTIRGGIPICFPWFRAKSDDAKAPAHGLVRTKAWELESIAEAGDSVVVTLATGNDDQGRRWWPHEFRLVHRITVGAELKLELMVLNTGTTAFQFEEALHTYHRVGDIEEIRISGLDRAPFLDNRDENREKIQPGEVRIHEATDNAYLRTGGAVEIADARLQRRVRLEKLGSETTIVWNPWADGAAVLADLGNEEWRQFVCVEASNILAAVVELEPGQTHTMTAVIGCLPDELRN